jgi:hypothetical protein
MIRMNPLTPIVHLIDPVDRYFRKAGVNQRKARRGQFPPRPSLLDDESFPGQWIRVRDIADQPGLSNATASLIAEGAVRIRTPYGLIGAKLVRFWTGSGLLDVQYSQGSPDEWGRGVSRIGPEQMKDPYYVARTYLEEVVASFHPGTPP